jgi:phosphatidylserine decarboxylase
MILFLTPYGWKEAALFTLFWCAVGAGMALLHPAAALVPLAGLVFTLSFFRDPARRVPPGEETLVAPADGRVTDILELTDPGPLKEPAVRVGIFLSVFDVHVNRTPCAGVVKATRYTPGEFLDARHPECDRRNERNDIVIERSGARDQVLVRQISGAIARRIVCACRENDVLVKGQRVGMIKFGSRTELYVPSRSIAEVTVKVGDKVKGGETVIARTR